MAQDKRIEDYLHLYLGCELWAVPIAETIGTLKGVFQNDVIFSVSGVIYSYPMYNYKPILRPLSDMSEEEAWECWRLCNGASGGNYGVTNPKCALTDSTFHADLSPDQWFLVTKYLLSKHFDLFGLIEAGVAIDKSKINK